MNKVFSIKSIFVFITLLVLIVVAFTHDFSAGNKVYDGEVVITYTDKDTYTPSRIVVKKGTKIRFVNKSGHDFWPASDFYPQNSNYPEFNPKMFIENGGEWSFVFDELGTWGYHDNLRPINKGVVIVVSGGKVYIPIEKGCGDLSKMDYSQRQVCWYNLVNEAVKKGGVKKALELFDKLYNNEPSFSQGCHDAMHLIGDAAYREYRLGKRFEFSSETSFCGYGFYHGFIEAMLYTTADFTEVRNFCESTNSNLKVNIENPNTIYSCYHGIGHATFDAHNPQIWGDEIKMVGPAISTCENVTAGFSEEKTKQCVTGVFNALGIAYSNNLYNFKLKKEDPVWYCRTLKTLYKKACFVEVSIAWITSQMGNYDYKFADGVKFVENLKDIEGEKSSMFSLSSDYARLHLNSMNNKEILALCRTVRSDLFGSCLEGLELALLNWGKPGEEYIRLISFCRDNDFAQSEMDDCFSYAFRGFTSLYAKDKRINICQNEVPKDYIGLCLNN